MAHVDCHSYITGRDVKYSLIGVKLKHKVKQEDYGASCSSNQKTYFNTSPNIESCEYITKLSNVAGYNGSIYTITGRGPQIYSASGVLDAEYENDNTGTNPIIASSTYSINEFNSGLNTRELYETDTVKIVLDVFKCKISETIYKQTYFKGIDEDIDILYKVYIRYILKSNNTIIGIYNISDRNNDGMFPITFTISTELFWIKDFNPINKSGFSLNYSYDVWLDSGYSNSGLYVDGIKSENPGDLIGAAFTLLCSEYWADIYYGDTEYHKYTIKKGSTIIPNSELRILNNKAGILYYRNEMVTNPNEFINLSIQTGNKYTGGQYLNATPTKRTTWANNTLNTEGYIITSEGYEDSNDIFRYNNFITTPILVPCINPSTFEPAIHSEEGMFISLTNNILEGPAPDQEPDEEPPEPETVEPADDPDTDYRPEISDGEKEFEFPESDTITGVVPLDELGRYRPNYSNFIFNRFYRDNETDINCASQFIEDASNPSAFELWGATFKLISGHPTPDEIISRVYTVPFEYTEVVEIMGVKEAAPVYGPIGPVTMGAKRYSDDNSNVGKADTSHVHYYDRLIERFMRIDLGHVNVDRVYLNYLDFTETKYTLHLPYGAGQVEIDPSYLFNSSSQEVIATGGTINIYGYLDFDTGELTIIVLINAQLYYQTTVNVAVDLLARVTDSTALPIAIAKASLAAGAAVGGLSRFFGNTSSNQTYNLKNSQELNRVQQLALEAAGDHIADLRTQIANLRKGGK